MEKHGSLLTTRYPQLGATHSSSHSSLQRSLHVKTPSWHSQAQSTPISRLLHAQRQLYKRSLNRSVQKLNTTISWARDSQYAMKQLEKWQTKLVTKRNAKLSVIIEKDSIVLKNETGREAPVRKNKEREEQPLQENHTLNAREESTLCLEGVFPKYRLGATLISHKARVYLYGGYSFRGLTESFQLHAYDDADKLWRKVQDRGGQLPFLCPCYHTAEQFGDYLIFVGGLSINAARNRRHFNSEINLFDTAGQVWSRIRWNNCLRSHASTLYANMLVIYGGINERDDFMSKLYFVALDPAAPGRSPVMQSAPLSRPHAGIAFHKMVNTYDLEPALRDRIDIDGLISYGGRFADGQLCGEVSLFRLNFKGRDNYPCGKPEVEDCNGWQVLHVKGLKPTARYDHSLNILNKKGLCLVIGGIDQQNMILADVWILDLAHLSWTQAEFDSQSSPTMQSGLAGHSSANENNTIFIFGGRCRDQTNNSKFLSLDFSSARPCSHPDERKQIRLVKKVSQVPDYQQP